jgi:metallo-beta-lactamase family protein
MLKVTFCGATRTVTGSLYYCEYQPKTGKSVQFCVDAGMFQIGRKINLYRINAFLLFDPKKVDFVLLTHGHLDHCGRLPYLVRMGFGGKIYTTPASKEIAEVVMHDAYKHQESPEFSEDSEWFEEDFLDSLGVGQKYSDILEEVVKAQESAEVIAQKYDFFKKLPDNYAKILNLLEKNEGKLFLYEKKDVDQTVTRFKTYDYHQPFLVHPSLEVTFINSGHIFGSSYILLKEKPTGRTIVFSGDVGNFHKPIIQDPEFIEPQTNLTHVFLESTYGDRLHPKTKPETQLRKIVRQALTRGGKVLIPAFSVERSQEIVYLLVELIRRNQIPPIPIYLDSPMAAAVTKVVLKYPHLYDEEMLQLVRSGNHPLKSKYLHILETPEESKLLNSHTKPAVIIAGSGMLNGGRILKHLKFHIENPRNLIALSGFQAPGTLGRALQEGNKEVEIEGRLYQVKAEVVMLEGLSGHGDQPILKKWLFQLLPTTINKPKPKVFVVHGEPKASLALIEEIRRSLPQVEAIWPEFGDEVILWDD